MPHRSLSARGTPECEAHARVAAPPATEELAGWPGVAGGRRGASVCGCEPSHQPQSRTG